ncbi:unnamed protein product [Porites lobata]|uniref:Uncharacterized protein n=1 Tax=Porites lobata TaxID=104759 RepID=A0ABN8QMC3_9CNID|nr:unnamed protein product [Porites lobata]
MRKDFGRAFRIVGLDGGRLVKSCLLSSCLNENITNGTGGVCSIRSYRRFRDKITRQRHLVIVQFDALDNEGYNIYLFHKPISNIIL